MSVVATYRPVVDAPGPLDSAAPTTRDCAGSLRRRMTDLAAVERFEDARPRRDRLVDLVRGTSRWVQRLDAVAAAPR